MPEGPEVRIITIELDRRLAGMEIVDVTFGDSKVAMQLRQESWDLPITIEGVKCRGKRLIFLLRSRGKSWFLTSTLGLEGRWTWEETPHTVITFILRDQSRCCYNDHRHFGKIRIYHHRDDLDRSILSEIGPDLLAYALRPTTEIPLERYRHVLRSCKGHLQLCQFLMNQRYFSGIGNYLKAEICYQARLRPDRQLESLTDPEIEELYRASLDRLKASFEAGGLTIKSYWSPNGRRGDFKVAVYGRSVDPLGNPVVTSTFADKRTTHWCPARQG